MKKNDEFILKIEDLSVDGAGIGKYEGMTFFVKDALVGDVIRARAMKLKKTYGFARMVEVLEASAHRVEPPCPIHRQCGGCQLQALSYEKQLEFKQKKVENNLRRIGGFADVPMEPILGMEQPFRYRNKAQFPIGTDKDGRIVAGFYAGRTHQIIPTGDCLLGVPINAQVLDAVIAYMEQYHIRPYEEKTQQGLVRHVLIRYGFSTKELMVCLVINARKLPHEEALIEALCAIDGMTSISVNCNMQNTNVILGDELRLLWGRMYIEDYIEDIKYQISPLSFYQVNPAQTEKMYRTALAYADLHGTETVWDLYCGIGTISLFLAKKAKQVYGVEIVPQAIEDAKRNAAENGISNAAFFVGKAEEVLPAFYEKGTEHPDVIVVDPPRKGCAESLLQTMLKMSPERIVYVSCDSATLARDAKLLCQDTYQLERVQVVDNFAQSVHTEAIALLTKRV